MNPFGKTELKRGKTSEVEMGRLVKRLSTNFVSSSKDFHAMDLHCFAWLVADIFLKLETSLH